VDMYIHIFTVNNRSIQEPLQRLASSYTISYCGELEKKQILKKGERNLISPYPPYIT